MLKTTLLAGALLCLPAMALQAQAARLISAPLSLDPLNGDPPHVTVEKLTCSVRYSGAGTIKGKLRLPDVSGTVNSRSSIVLGPTTRNFTYTTTRIGDAPVEGFMCDFDFPGVDAARLRAAACITAPAYHTVICLPVY